MAALRIRMVLAAAVALQAAAPLIGSAGAESVQAAGSANVASVRVRPAATVALPGPLVTCDPMSPEPITGCGSSPSKLLAKPADASDDVTGSTGPRPMVECSLFTNRPFARCSD